MSMHPAHPNDRYLLDHALDDQTVRDEVGFGLILLVVTHFGDHLLSVRHALWAAGSTWETTPSRVAREFTAQNCCPAPSSSTCTRCHTAAEVPARLLLAALLTSAQTLKIVLFVVGRPRQPDSSLINPRPCSISST
jgi:hypothetical protein